MYQSTDCTASTSQFDLSSVLNTSTILSSRKVAVATAIHSRAWIPPSTQTALVWPPLGDVPTFNNRIFRPS